MTKTALILSAAAVIGLGAIGSAQAAPARHAHRGGGELASKAQLAREHARALKAGDTANDPYSSASSDALNQQQLAQAQSVMGAGAAGSADVQPGAINGNASGAANTSGADANVNGSMTGSVTGNTGTGSSAGNDTMGSSNNGANTVPPQSPPVNGTTSGTQNTPQSSGTNGTVGGTSGTTTPQ